MTNDLITRLEKLSGPDMTRARFRCHECDEWSKASICPECGGPCAIYAPPALRAREATKEG